MDPLVELYKKHFNEETMKSTSLIREAHVKIKTRLSKQMPAEEGILKMVVENLPSPCEA